MYTKEESMHRMFVAITHEFMVMCDRFQRIHEVIALYDENKGTMDPFLYEKCYGMFSASILALDEQIRNFQGILIRLQAYLDSVAP